MSDRGGYRTLSADEIRTHQNLSRSMGRWRRTDANGVERVERLGVLAPDVEAEAIATNRSLRTPVVIRQIPLVDLSMPCDEAFLTANWKRLTVDEECFRDEEDEWGVCVSVKDNRFRWNGRGVVRSVRDSRGTWRVVFSGPADRLWTDLRKDAYDAAIVARASEAYLCDLLRFAICETLRARGVVVGIEQTSTSGPNDKSVQLDVSGIAGGADSGIVFCGPTFSTALHSVAVLIGASK